MASLPYISSPGNIDKALAGIKSAAVPDRVSQDFVKTILKIPGGSGDQMTAFLKKLGFANADGSPNEAYRKFRNPTSSGGAIANAIKSAYAPLYVRNEFMHELTDPELLGLVTEETGLAHDAKPVTLDSTSAINRKQRIIEKATEYEQFEEALRSEAARMSEFYEVFYCLENSIRKLVADIMIEAEGADWWTSGRVDEKRIREPAALRHKKEIDSGITPRSESLIDYTTFGELSQLITDNWELFDPVFQSKTAVSNVSNQLNLLRGPIAHCNPTDELEQDRLNLAVRTWFKIMS